MTLHIRYIDKKKNFLFEEENSFDKLTKNNYIIDKLKELLFKSVPDLMQASKKIINFCTGLAEFLYNKLNKRLIESTNTKDVLNVLYNVINNIFTNIQSEIIVLDKTILDQNSIEINEFLKENIVKKNTILININDAESINKICKFKEIKLFAIKTEKNYICMPLDDKDFKGFKAISVMEYYHSYYNIPDDIYTELVDLILDFSDFLKKNPNFKEDKQYQFHDLSIEFEYHEDVYKIRYGGYFSELEQKIVITFTDFEEFTENFSFKIIAMIHEYIHYMDSVRNKDKFTNWDLTELTNKIFAEYGNSEEIDLKELQEEMGIKDTSAFRYLIGLMQKHKYIDYAKTSDGKSNYTKIKVLIDTELGTPDNNVAHSDVNYFNDSVELNTHVSNLTNDLIEKINNYLVLNMPTDQNLDINNFIETFFYEDEDKEHREELNNDFYISENCLEANAIPFIFPNIFWKKIDKIIKNNHSIDKIANEDILFLDNLIKNGKNNIKNKKDENIPKFAIEKFNILKKLQIFKIINIDEFKDMFIDFFKSYDYDDKRKKKYENNYKKLDERNNKIWDILYDEPFFYIKSFIEIVFIKKEYISYLDDIIKFENDKNKYMKAFLKFKKDNFKYFIKFQQDKVKTYIKKEIEESAESYAQKQIEIYMRRLSGEDYAEEEINKYYEQIKENYIQILNEKTASIIEDLENKYMEDVKNKLYKKNNLDTEELQEIFLLRQYISLLIH